MSPQRIAGIALLVIGAVVLLFGFNASDSVADQVSETFTGRFTDKTMWYIIGGAALGAVGLALTVMGGPRGKLS